MRFTEIPKTARDVLMDLLKGNEPAAEDEKDLAALDWLRDQIVNDNDLEICATEEERVKMLAMLSRQKKRRKAIVDSETKLL